MIHYVSPVIFCFYSVWLGLFILSCRGLCFFLLTVAFEGRDIAGACCEMELHFPVGHCCKLGILLGEVFFCIIRVARVSLEAFKASKH